MNADVNIVDGSGETPKDIAKKHHHFECLRILKSSGCSKSVIAKQQQQRTMTSSSSEHTPKHRNLMYTSAI